MSNLEKPWIRFKSEKARPYKFFLKYLKGEDNLKDFHQKLQNEYEKGKKKNKNFNPKPPMLNTLYQWSYDNDWKKRKIRYDEYLLEKELVEIEKIGRKKKLERLEYNNKRLEWSRKIMEKAMKDPNLKANSKAYILAQTAHSDRVSVESDRLDTNQSTGIIQKKNSSNGSGDVETIFKEIERMKKYFKKE